MSALGKSVLEGDFDTNGQVVVQTPKERVIGRSVVVTRTLTEAPPREAAKTAPKPVTPAAQEHVRHNGQPPLPYPLAPRPSAGRPDRWTMPATTLLTPFGKATLTDRYLMPGESFQDMFARVSCAYADDVDARPAPVRLYEPAVVHARHPDPVQWRHQARPADLLLPQRCLRFAGRHCRHLERECRLASNGGGIGTYWGKVRSIGEKVKTGKTSGIIPFIHVMDGLTLAISPGLAAARLGGGLSRHHPSGDRGVPGDPQGLGRLQPQGPEPASRHQHHRRIHGLRAARARCSALRSPKDQRSPARGQCPPALAAHPGNPAADRRALYPQHRRGEPGPAQASARAGAEGQYLQPVQRDHPADRHRP